MTMHSLQHSFTACAAVSPYEGLLHDHARPHDGLRRDELPGGGGSVRVCKRERAGERERERERERESSDQMNYLEAARRVQQSVPLSLPPSPSPSLSLLPSLPPSLSRAAIGPRVRLDPASVMMRDASIVNINLFVFAFSQKSPMKRLLRQCLLPTH
jgi:hypothetical protein